MNTAAVLQPEDPMTKRIHTTLSGHHIEYDPSPEVAAFLSRLEDMIADPKISEQEMIGVAYSRENPIMDPTLHPTRAVVTKEVFANPAYQVIGDLLFRKRVAQERVDVAKLAAKYTMTIAEAAEDVGVHQSSIRQAIEARRLASWVKNGKHYLEPRSLASFKLSLADGGKRGPKAKGSGHELDIVLGHAPGQSLRVRAATGVDTVERVEGNIVRGRVAKWERVVVLTTRGQNKRAFVIEPADEDGDITHGPFHVRGRFRVVERANASKKAGELYDASDVR